jgi:VanZ family protein
MLLGPHRCPPSPEALSPSDHAIQRGTPELLGHALSVGPAIVRSGSTIRFGLLTVIIAGIIVYGSLYPFEFRIPAQADGPVATLLRSWATPPGRGDFVANVLLYSPLGWFGLWSLPWRLSVGIRLSVILLVGAALSVAMELAQYYDAGRVTSADDVYANALGTFIGSLGAVIFGAPRLPRIAQLRQDPFPVALIAAWLGYRLYPYVPTVDLHKFWTALKPVILNPSLSLVDFYRHTTIWLTLFALIAALVSRGVAAILAPLFCGCLLAARVAIVGTTLSLAEIAGGVAALCLWPIMLALKQRQRAAALFALLLVAVIIERLEPVQFQAVTHSFGWVPFRSMVAGSLAVNVMAFFEKSFLYGSLLYLFTGAGGELRVAVLIVGGSLLATSWAETYLPGRSAEITDFVMALLLAGGLAVVGRPSINMRKRSPTVSSAMHGNRETGETDAVGSG